MDIDRIHLSPAQAAELSGVSLYFVYKWCDSKMLPHRRVLGYGMRRIYLINLYEFMKQHKLNLRKIECRYPQLRQL